MSYITFKDLGKTGDTCSQIQQYASLYAVAKKNNKEIVFTESAYNAKCKHSTGEYEGFRFLNLLDISFSVVPDSEIEFVDIEVDVYKTIDPIVFECLKPDVNYNITTRFDSYHYWYELAGDDMFNLKFKKEVQEEAIKNINFIKDKYPDKILVSLHCRRGDYTSPVHKTVFAQLNSQYYGDAITKHFLDIYNQCVFLIFSDDIEYCKKSIISPSDNIEYIKGNDYVDMCMMSLCEHNIIANSSYSWWAAYLNKNPNKKIVCPINYVVHDSDFSNMNGNYYPKKWNGIFNKA